MTEEVIDNLNGENEIVTPEKDNSPQEDPKAVRHAQQLAGSKAEAERLEKIAIAANAKLADADAQNLLELHDTDPKLAEKVAKVFGYSSFSAAQEAIENGIKMRQQQEDDFDAKYQKKRAEEKHQEALELAETFIVKTRLDEDQQEQARVFFDKITKGRMLTSAEALEAAEMATLYVQKEKIKEGTYQEGLKQLSSTGVGSSKKVTATKESDSYEVIRDGKIVLISNKSK